MKITILSGGTGNNALYKGIKQFYSQADIKVIVNAYDSGKSTGICRRITNTLGVSDIRKNHSRLYSISKNPNKNYMEFLEGRYNLSFNKEKEQILEKLNYWGIKEEFILDSINYFFELYNNHNEKYDFNDFNIANIVYSSLFNKYGYEKTCDLMTKFLEIENHVILNSFDNVYIKAITKNNNTIEDEGDLVEHKNDKDPIVSLKFDGNQEKGLNKKAINRVIDSDFIIISSGTFWSSIYPTLKYKDFYKYINESKAKKVWIINNEQDKDAYGVSSNDFINLFEKLGLNLKDFIIIENNDANEILRLKNNNYNIKYYSLGNEKGKHNANLVSKCVLKEYYNLNNDLVLDFDDTIWARNWKNNEESHNISRENVKLLNEIEKNVTIMSGNSYNSIKEKLKTIYGSELSNFNPSIIADANSVLYKKDKKEYIFEKLVISNKNIEFIYNILKEYNFKIEIPEDKTYIKIKPINNEYRKILSDYLNLIFKNNNINLKANITGTTTIDIVALENDKSIILKETNWISKESTYIGDEIDHGNDNIISKLCKNYIKVKDVFETNTFLRLLK